MRRAEIRIWETLELEGRERGWNLVVGYEVVGILSNITCPCCSC